jgi:alpha-ketoglutaric semialdehyde dehydrogenase
VSVAAIEIVSRSPHDPDDVVGRFRPGGGIEVDRAASAAAGAAPAWGELPAAERADALRRAADDLESAAGELGELVCREVGKPIREARGEVVRTAAILRYHAGTALDPEGESLPPADGRSLLLTRRVPRGVVGLVTPWNFPLAIPAWKLAPALVNGNACVWKPSEHSPACAERLAEILAPHLPKGVLHVVHGFGDTGSALVRNARVAAVSFTGSERTGLEVAATVAGRGAAVQCEMGGQNASIVLADADLPAAARTIAAAAMGFAGQKCTATSRVVCERSVLDELRELLVREVCALGVEDPSDESCVVGPLISADACTRAMAAVDRALEAGGRLLTGGVGCSCDGHYLGPTLVELDDPSAELAQEEVFAPVCALLAADDADQAVSIANGVRHGLATSLFTTDLDAALLLTRRIASGLVRVNQPTSGVDFHAPFGGEGASGIGPREQGRAARELYTSVRTLLVSPARA